MDSPGIEPGLHPCEGYVLPLYYEPKGTPILYLVTQITNKFFIYLVYAEGTSFAYGVVDFGVAGGDASFDKSSAGLIACVCF